MNMNLGSFQPSKAIARLKSKERASGSGSNTRGPTSPATGGQTPPQPHTQHPPGSLPAHLDQVCPDSANMMAKQRAVRVMLPAAVVRGCTLKFNYEHQRVLFGRDDKWKYYEIDNIDSYADGEPVLRAHCNIGTNAERDAKDFIAVPAAICSLSMKGLPSPFVFRFDTVEEKQAFLVVIRCCCEYVAKHQPVAAPTSEPLVTRSASNSRLTVPESNILTGGGEEPTEEPEPPPSLQKGQRAASKSKWTTRPTDYWRSPG